MAVVPRRLISRGQISEEQDKKAGTLPSVLYVRAILYTVLCTVLYVIGDRDRYQEVVVPNLFFFQMFSSSSSLHRRVGLNFYHTNVTTLPYLSSLKS